MDRNYYQDDEFEQFLQDEVKQHRMYPADHVWNNIRTELHGNPSWPALTFISLLINPNNLLTIDKPKPVPPYLRV